MNGAAQRWIAGIEEGVGKALTKAARQRPTALELDAFPYLKTFDRQARAFAAKAQDLAAKGDRPGAVAWAKEAERAALNLSRIQAAIAA